ncbi:MAG: hypothetical protein IJA77_03460 [Clostridia bacterium]|nr:hypothetical protein [Clostridia bacterium]
MKIRQLADAAIVAALLMASIPGAAPDLTPAELLSVAAYTADAPLPNEPDHSAARELS